MDKSAQIERATRFRNLHDRSRVLLLPNAWDAASARIFADLGFAAIATTSGGVAWSLGHADGEQLPLADVVAASARIAGATTLPVSVDFEAGFGDETADVARSVAALITAGVAGLNIEDGVRHESLRTVDDAAARVAAARAAAQASGVPLVINARVDVWMVGSRASEEQKLADALQRARAYLAAGADCVYPIGLVDAGQIAAFVRALESPVNVGARPGLPDMDTLSRLGVARVSTATRLATVAYSAARDAARALLVSGGFDALEARFGYPDMQRISAPAGRAP